MTAVFQSKSWIAEGIEQYIYQRESPPEPIDFDVIIIGSGYGGAIAAAELAGCKDKSGDPEKSLKVCVLERGKEYIPGSFPSRQRDLPTHVRASMAEPPGVAGASDALFDIRMGSDLNVILGNGLGGGSLINAGVMEEPLPHIFDKRWPKALRPPGVLSDWYGEAKELLGASHDDQPNTIENHPQHQQHPLDKFESLKKLASGDPSGCTFRPAAITVCMKEGKANSAGVKLNRCKLCGDCASGCNHGAKDSLDTNLLVKAKQQGARIFTGASVISLDQCPDSKIWSLEVVYTRKHLRERQGKPFVLKASKVIVAAGSLGSTEILMRSQQKNRLQFSTRLGKDFSSNGDMLAVGYGQKQPANTLADEQIDPDRRRVGPTITGVIDGRDKRKKKGVLIEEMSVPAPLKRLFSELFTTANTLHGLAESDTARHQDGYVENDPAGLDEQVLKHSSLYAVMGHDDEQSAGSLELEHHAIYPKEHKPDPWQEGMIRVRWPQINKVELFTEQVQALEKLTDSSDSGGRILPNPLWKLLPDPMMFLLNNQAGPLMTVHPLGGCGMGDDAGSGVVDEYGRVYRGQTQEGGSLFYEGLCVLDGAIIPGSLGINPALTISAVALRGIRQLKQEWGYVDQKEKGDAVPLPRPTLAGKNSKSQPAKQTDMATEVEVIERLTGELRLHDDEGRPQQVVVELTLAFASKNIRDLSRHSEVSKTNPRAGRLYTRRNDPKTPATEKSQLRIYHKHDWDKAQKQTFSPENVNKLGTDLEAIERILDKEALVVADVSGALDVFTRAGTSRLSRVLRVFGYAWLFNRGMRDTWQHLFPKDYEKKEEPEEEPKNQGMWARFRNSLRLASHAGEKRLLEYWLTVGNVRHRPDASFRLAIESGQVIEGFKEFTYARRCNPWWQLSEVMLTRFPGLREKPQDSILRLDTRFLARIGVPLIRLSKQGDHFDALMDLLSLGTYLGRLLLTIHMWSFRAPDVAAPHEHQRLPGKITNLPEPQVRFIKVGKLEESVDRLPAGMDVHICLTRYPRYNSSKNPVVMVHGYSASGASFTHDSINKTLVESFWEDDRDVWVLDMRTSPGMPTPRYPWSFEDVAGNDIPIAINHIYHASNGKPVDALVHCMGAVMFSMSALRPDIINLDNPYFDDFREAIKERNVENFYQDRVNAVIFSQVTPMVVFGPGNRFRSFITHYVKDMVPRDYHFKPLQEPGLQDQLMDRLFYTLPYPKSEFDIENPIIPWKRVTFTRTRHRMDALYGRDFNLQQVDEAVLDNIDDLFGPLSIDTLTQTIHFSRLNVITDAQGNNDYVSVCNMQNWTFPTCGFHGGDNGLADIATADRTRQFFKAAGKDYHIIQYPDKYGHQDSLIGRNVHEDVATPVLDFLKDLEARRADRVADTDTEIGCGAIKTDSADPATSDSGRLSIEIPWFGPVIFQPEKEYDYLRVLTGLDPVLEHACNTLFVPVQKVGNRFELAGPGDTDQERLKWFVDEYLRMGNKKRETETPKSLWPERFKQYQSRHEIRVEAYPQHLYQKTADHDGALVLTMYSRFPLHPPSLPGRMPDGEVCQSMMEALEAFFSKASAERMEQAYVPAQNDHSKSSDALTLAFGSCQYPAGMIDQKLAYRGYARLAEDLRNRYCQPDLLLLMGDQVYTDATAGFFDPRSLTDRFVTPYQNWLRNAHVREVLRQLPLRTMLDDHEIVDNWEPMGDDIPEQYCKVHKNLMEYAENGIEASLCFQRGLPFETKKVKVPVNEGSDKKDVMRVVNPNDNDLPRLWYDFNHQGFDFFMLDTRTDRSARNVETLYDESTTLISEDQFNDLIKWLEQTKSQDNRPRFIVSSSMLMPFHKHQGTNVETNVLHDDGWCGYPTTLRKLLNHILDNEYANLVFLSGDEHLSLSASITLRKKPKEIQFYSIHSSGLYSPFSFANASLNDYASCPDNSLLSLGGQQPAHCKVVIDACDEDSSIAYLRVEKVAGEWVIHPPEFRGPASRLSVPE